MTGILSSEQIAALKAKYPQGTRIKLDRMGPDPYSRLPDGLEGSVISVDDIGTVHVLWDDRGLILGLIEDVDRFHIIAKEKNNTERGNDYGE